MVAMFLWLAVAWTAQGPVVAHFDNLHDCKVAVAYARMQDYVRGTTDCIAITPDMLKKTVEGLPK